MMQGIAFFLSVVVVVTVLATRKHGRFGWALQLTLALQLLAVLLWWYFRSRK